MQTVCVIWLATLSPSRELETSLARIQNAMAGFRIQRAHIPFHGEIESCGRREKQGLVRTVRGHSREMPSGGEGIQKADIYGWGGGVVGISSTIPLAAFWPRGDGLTWPSCEFDCPGQSRF